MSKMSLKKGDDTMNIRLTKILSIAFVLFFLSGCAVFISDGDWHHHRHG